MKMDRKENVLKVFDTVHNFMGRVDCIWTVRSNGNGARTGSQGILSDPRTYMGWKSGK